MDISSSVTMCLVICQTIDPSVVLLVHLFIHLVISQLSIHQLIYTSISLSLYVHINTFYYSINPYFICPQVHPSIHASICPLSIIPSHSFNQFVHYTIICCLLISRDSCPSIFPMDE